MLGKMLDQYEWGHTDTVQRKALKKSTRRDFPTKMPVPLMSLKDT